jgi:hypothetical protein
VSGLLNVSIIIMKMLRQIFICLFTIFSLLSIKGAILPHQGRILVNNESFNGDGFFKFALVNQNDKIRWNHENGVDYPDGNITIRVNKGFYQCKLGDVSVIGMEPLSDDLFLFDDPLKLRIWFSDGSSAFEQLGPDQPLLVAAYALTTPWGKNEQITALLTDELEEQATDQETTPHTLIENLVSLAGNTLADPSFNGSISISMLSESLSAKFNDLENNVTNLKVYDQKQDTNLSISLEVLNNQVNSISNQVSGNISDLNAVQSDLSFVETNNTILGTRLTEVDETLSTMEAENIDRNTQIDENERRIQDIRNKGLIQDANLTKIKSDLSNLTNRVNELDGNFSSLQSLLKDYLEPKIIGSPVFSSNLAGDNITVSVGVEGRQLVYQWFKDGQEILGATLYTYEMLNASANLNNGSYNLQVSNAFGEFTSAASVLTIVVP